MEYLKITAEALGSRLVLVNSNHTNIEETVLTTIVR